MVDLGRASAPRTTSVLLATLTVVAVTARALIREGPAIARPGPRPHVGADFGTDLTLAATGLLLVVALWASAVLAGVLVATVRGRHPTTAVRWCPAAWRPLVLAVCGAGLAVGTAAPGFAGAHVQPATGDAVLRGLAHLDPPLGSAPTAAVTPAPPRASGDIVVRPGDSLWTIVERRHPRASETTVARAVAALYAGNREVIGDDPGLIVPGERLRPPDDASWDGAPSDGAR